MILVFQDDGTVRPLDNGMQANRDYESIDVENGAYIFVDDRGSILRPVLQAPSEQKLFGLIPVVRHLPFSLEPTEEKDHELLARLRRGEIPVDKGPTSIGTLDDLRRAAPQIFSNEN